MDSETKNSTFNIIVVFLCIGIFALFANVIIQNVIGDKIVKDVNSELTVISDFELKDMMLEGSVFTSLSDDSWIVKRFEQGKNLKKIIINVEEMSVSSSNVMILYDSEDFISGNNYIVGSLKG